MPAEAPVLLRPVPALDDAAERQKIMSALKDSDIRVFVYFQEKLGGEIGLPKTPASPDMSFDITVVELLAGWTQRTGTRGAAGTSRPVRGHRDADHRHPRQLRACCQGASWRP